MRSSIVRGILCGSQVTYPRLESNQLPVCFFPFFCSTTISQSDRPTASYGFSPMLLYFIILSRLILLFLFNIFFSFMQSPSLFNCFYKLMIIRVSVEFLHTTSKWIWFWNTRKYEFSRYELSWYLSFTMDYVSSYQIENSFEFNSLDL